jgi:very-short-patch-repair endonuclease
MPRISSIEIKMAEAFEQIGLNPESQYIIGPFVADFAFPDHKLVVECDGDYWHNLPHIQKKDKIKNYYYWKTGWRIVRLWEHEINASSIECAIRVQSHLHDLTSS